MILKVFPISLVRRLILVRDAIIPVIDFFQVVEFCHQVGESLSGFRIFGLELLDLVFQGLNLCWIDTIILHKALTVRACIDLMGNKTDLAQ